MAVSAALAATRRQRTATASLQSASVPPWRPTERTTAPATWLPTTGWFSVRLRDQVDLDTFTTELLAVVDRTIEPTTSSLWLRPQAIPEKARPGSIPRHPIVDRRDKASTHRPGVAPTA